MTAAPWTAEAVDRVRARVPDAADEDIAAVLNMYRERPSIRDPVAFAVSGVNGSLARDLADAAGRRHKAERRHADDERRKEPPCPHGDPGGAVLQPGSGGPWCPLCRAEAKGRPGAGTARPAPAGRSKPEPSAAVVTGAPQGDQDGRDDQEEEFFLPAAPVFPFEQACGPLRDLLDWAAAAGLPVSYVAAAAEVAAAGAAAWGPGAELRLTGARVVRPVLWQVMIGDSGDGKNPAVRHATGPANDHYAGLLARYREDGAQCRQPQKLIQGNISAEAMVRWLEGTGGAGILCYGELASFLCGLGQYKRGGGSDRFDVMDIWSGDPVSIERVGQGGRKNAISIHVPVPRLSVTGGLVPDNLKLLGPESDGLRARFLPVLPSSQVIPRIDGGEGIPGTWDDSIKRLYECQERREWTLGAEARTVIKAAVRRWTERKSRGADPVTVRTALAKADEQCLRIALTVSELAEPGKGGGEIPAWAAVYAVARVDYALDCWRALGSDQTMAFSRKDEVINMAVASLLRLIERQPAGQDERKSMTRRAIQQSQVGGASTPYHVDELIRAYLRAYPRTVIVFTEADHARFPAARREERPGGRGPAPIIVCAPRRRQAAEEE